jgi:hypothetical protein
MAYSFLQSVDAGSTGSGSSLGVSITYTGGEHAYVFGTITGTVTTWTVTDNSGGSNVYTQLGSTVAGLGGDNEAIFECASVVAGTFTVTHNWGTAGTFRGIHVWTYNGVTGSSITVSNTQNGPGTGADAVTSTNLNPSSQPGALIGHTYDTNGNALNAGTGFTSRSTFPSEAATNGVSTRLEDKRLTSTSAVPATFTLTTGTDKPTTFAFWDAELLTPVVVAWVIA